MRISDWSSDVCSSDLQQVVGQQQGLARSRGEWCALFEARRAQRVQQQRAADDDGEEDQDEQPARRVRGEGVHAGQHARAHQERRSEEHTSELQSLMRISYAVLCLKKNSNNANKKQ